MAKYKGKAIFETDVSKGNIYREKYLNSINRFIEKEYGKASGKRNSFVEDIVKNQSSYREKYIKMIGQPISPYPANIPKGKMQHAGKDDFSDIYYLHIETMPDFWFFGILMVPFGVKSTPLVIAQHGGWGTPEKCSDFLGENNYGFFTKKALEKGMTVFAPQLLLWRID